MRTTFNVSFVCRKSKANKAGLSPIELSIVINGERTYLTLPRKERYSVFEKLYKSKRQNDLTIYLNEIYSKINKIQTEMLQQSIPLTAYNLKEYLQTGCVSSYTVERLFNDYLSILAKRVGVSLTDKVYRKYELVKEMFIKIAGKDRQVSSISNSLILTYKAEVESKYQQSTAAGYLTRLKTIIQFAIDNGKLTIDPFIGIKIDKGEKEVEFLTQEEVNRIRTKQFSVERLNKVRDLFLFQCYTGLAYTDLALLSKSDFQQNEFGQIYIKKKRQKTGVYFTAILLNDAIDIANKYNFELPILSNQKYNAYLKEIADICGISKPLHTHIGRHTAATYLLNKGISLDVVAQILGHSNTRITKHYAKLVDTTIFKEVAKII